MALAVELDMTRLYSALTLVTLGVLVVPSVASAADAKLAWDANTETDLVGYVVKYGTSPTALTSQVTVAKTAAPTVTITGLADGSLYYFAVQAYNAASLYSSMSNLVPFTTPSTTAVLGTTNINGRLDLAWQNQVTGSIVGWQMNGTNAVTGGNFSTPTVAAGWQIRALGDLNRDDNADLIWQHPDGWVAVWFMRGNTVSDTRFLVIGTTIQKVTDTNWKVVGSADFNNDGRSDIVWHHQTNGMIAVWLMWDNTVLDTRVLATLDPKWKLVGVGDLNRDNQPDLVWQHDDGWLAGWYIRNLAVSDTGYLSTNRLGDTNWKIRGLRDVNNDLRADLLFQHQLTGDLAAWYMDGLRIADTSWLSPSQITDPNWKIVGAR